MLEIKKRSKRALAERRAYGLQQMKETRRELFPDLYPTDDNYPLYQSFLEKYKFGTILNEVFRLKYYNTLFPAMDTMRNTLSDIEPSIDYSSQSSRDKSSPQILASTFNNTTSNDVSNEEEDDMIETREDEDQSMYQMNDNNEEDDDEESDEYDYEYEYEYETDDEYEHEEDEEEEDEEYEEEEEEDGEEEERDDKK